MLKVAISSDCKGWNGPPAGIMATGILLVRNIWMFIETRYITENCYATEDCNYKYRHTWNVYIHQGIFEHTCTCTRMHTQVYIHLHALLHRNCCKNCTEIKEAKKPVQANISNSCARRLMVFLIMSCT